MIPWLVTAIVGLAGGIAWLWERGLRLSADNEARLQLVQAMDMRRQFHGEQEKVERLERLVAHVQAQLHAAEADLEACGDPAVARERLRRLREEGIALAAAAVRAAPAPAPGAPAGGP